MENLYKVGDVLKHKDSSSDSHFVYLDILEIVFIDAISGKITCKNFSDNFRPEYKEKLLINSYVKMTVEEAMLYKLGL